MNRGLSWAAAGQTLTFTFLKQAQNTSNRGILGCERLERLSRDLLGLNFCLEENREESQGSVRASPSPALHQPHWGVERQTAAACSAQQLNGRPLLEGKGRKRLERRKEGGREAG